MGVDLAYEQSFPTPLAHSAFLPLLLLSLAVQRNTPKTTNTIRDSYDFIVVGGGAGGSVVASRLSENPSNSVLLLEAGKLPPLLTSVPMLDQYFQTSEISWNFTTVAQKHTAGGHANRKLKYPAAKTLGGNSAVDAMVAIRGNRKIFNEWALKYGAKGWSYKDVLPYFIKLENYNLPVSDPQNHGYKGPLHIQPQPYNSVFREAVFDAFHKGGYPYTDPNGPQEIGFFDSPLYMLREQRFNPAKAYLVPAGDRTNINIVTEALVKKIVMKDNRAVGVVVERDGESHVVYANKEVIVSAGAVKSPQLLMLSGIGPTEELQKFGIKVIVDLPVGKNFQDYAVAGIDYELKYPLQPNDKRAQNPWNILQYVFLKKGPLASPGSITNVALLKNGRKQYNTLPNSELYFVESGIDYFNVNNNEQIQKHMKEKSLKHVVSCLSQQVNPRSRGTITLKSSNPHDDPLIDPNYFADPKDIKDVVGGLKHCMAILSSSTLRKLGSKYIDPPLEACRKKDNYDEHLECIVKNFIFSGSNQSGSCRMGGVDRRDTVVDPRLKVKGIHGLRVVDGSILPKITSGNILVPIVMIAEKAADMIKEDNN